MVLLNKKKHYLVYVSIDSGGAFGCVCCKMCDLVVGVGVGVGVYVHMCWCVMQLQSYCTFFLLKINERIQIKYLSIDAFIIAACTAHGISTTNASYQMG